MRNKFGLLCMFLGTVLILAALSLCLVNHFEDVKAGQMSEEVVLKMEEHLRDIATELKEPQDPIDPTMAEIEIDGYRYIGILEVEKLGLSLPVMSTWSYEQLRIAPCRYSGSTKTDDIVIAGHNYARHFSPVKYLLVGDTVYFTDVEGYTIEYAVAAVEVLQPTAVEEMTAGEFDLTLFTCSYGGQSRVAVRCDRVEP